MSADKYPRPTSVAGKTFDSTLEELIAEHGEPLETPIGPVPQASRQLLPDMMFGWKAWNLESSGGLLLCVMIPPLEEKPTFVSITAPVTPKRGARTMLSLAGLNLPRDRPPTMIAGSPGQALGRMIAFSPYSPHLASLLFIWTKAPIEQVTVVAERPSPDEFRARVAEYERQYDWEGTKVFARAEDLGSGKPVITEDYIPGYPRRGELMQLP